jgi:phosphatidylinositol alpha-mannosyltransferase
MAAGTPVVASALDGYRNVASHDVDAILVPPGEPAALADALRTVLYDHEAAERLRLAGVSRAQGFSMSALAQHYLVLYRKAIASDWKGRRSSAAAPSPWRRRMMRLAKRG